MTDTDRGRARLEFEDDSREFRFTHGFVALAWGEDLWNRINAKFNVALDAYEEDLISASDLPGVIKELELFADSTEFESIRRELIEAISFLHEADQRGLRVWVYL